MFTPKYFIRSPKNKDILLYNSNTISTLIKLNIDKVIYKLIDKLIYNYIQIFLIILIT